MGGGAYSRGDLFNTGGGGLIELLRYFHLMFGTKNLTTKKNPKHKNFIIKTEQFRECFFTFCNFKLHQFVSKADEV